MDCSCCVRIRTRWYSSLLVCVCALVVAFVLPAPSSAQQRVLTWNLTSRYVTSKDAIAGLTGSVAASAGPTGLRTWVVLPTDYTPSRCWPVLYLLHSSGVVREWLWAESILANLNAIVVIPGGGDSQYSNWWNNGKRSPGFENWILDELLPTVSRRLPICASRQSHAIAGASMGGFGALYLASQRPDYFGTAATFSGVNAITDPIIELGFSLYTYVWGPTGGFYAIGHDPVHLLENLRHTRLLAESGNGSPINAADTDPGNGRLIELAMIQETNDFVAAARKARAQLTFIRHAGIHTEPNFQDSLSRFIAWNPFGAVTSDPASWTFATVRTTGQAWGYRYAFASAPMQLERFSYRNHQLRVDGSGRVTLWPPNGRRITARLPFTLRGRVVRQLKPGQTNGSQAPATLPVALSVTPARPSRGKRLTVRFRTDRRLRTDQTYELIVRQAYGGCILDATARVRQRSEGKLVTVQISPGRGSGHPAGRWCRGGGRVELLIVPRDTTGLQIGRYIGAGRFNAR